VAWLQRGKPAVDLNFDPLKGSHTAVALDRAENKLGQLRVHLAVVPACHAGLGGWANVRR
jgi:hypothetical protein